MDKLSGTWTGRVSSSTPCFEEIPRPLAAKLAVQPSESVTLLQDYPELDRARPGDEE